VSTVEELDELRRFMIEVWPRRHGESDSLMGWLSRAQMAFPDVDLLNEARKAAVWESEKASNKKKSARRFLTNWWGRTQESSKKDAPVVSLDAVRWLSKNNKHPDYKFEAWVHLDPEGGRNTPEAVMAFCGYMGVTPPSSCEEVIDVFLGGV
jgi:hypothetical protein